MSAKSRMNVTCGLGGETRDVSVKVARRKRRMTRKNLNRSGSEKRAPEAQKAPKIECVPLKAAPELNTDQDITEMTLFFNGNKLSINTDAKRGCNITSSEIYSIAFEDHGDENEARGLTIEYFRKPIGKKGGLEKHVLHSVDIKKKHQPRIKQLLEETETLPVKRTVDGDASCPLYRKVPEYAKHFEQEEVQDDFLGEGSSLDILFTRTTGLNMEVVVNTPDGKYRELPVYMVAFQAPKMIFHFWKDPVAREEAQFSITLEKETSKDIMTNLYKLDHHGNRLFHDMKKGPFRIINLADDTPQEARDIILEEPMQLPQIPSGPMWSQIAKPAKRMNHPEPEEQKSQEPEPNDAISNLASNCETKEVHPPAPELPEDFEIPLPPQGAPMGKLLEKFRSMEKSTGSSNNECLQLDDNGNSDTDTNRRLADVDSMRDNALTFVCFLPFILLLVLIFKRFSQSCFKNDEENHDHQDAEVDDCIA